MATRCTAPSRTLQSSPVVIVRAAHVQALRPGMPRWRSTFLRMYLSNTDNLYVDPDVSIFIIVSTINVKYETLKRANFTKKIKAALKWQKSRSTAAENLGGFLRRLTRCLRVLYRSASSW